MIARAVLLLLLAAAWPAAAQTTATTTEKTGAPADVNIAAVNAGTIGVVSGGIDGTYIRIAADLAAVLDDGDRLRVLAIISKGSLANISDIMFLHGIDIGIVQSDVLSYVQRRKRYPGVEQSLQYIAKLYDEELHLLAGKDVASLQDLTGKTVNVDVVGSGTAMTASVVFDSFGIAVKIANDDQATALDKLRKGEIAALAYVTGQPARLFTGVSAAGGLHFLAVPMTPKLVETYAPSKLGHGDYPALIPDGGDVETIAIGSVMAVYAWPPNTDRYRRVARFVTAFFDKFPAFLAPPRHPKWKEVNLAAQIPGWTRFPAAEEWLRTHPAAGSR